MKLRIYEDNQNKVCELSQKFHFWHAQTFESMLIFWPRFAVKMRLHWLWKFLGMTSLSKFDQSIYLKNEADSKNNLAILLSSNLSFWFANVTTTLSSFIKRYFFLKLKFQTFIKFVACRIWRQKRRMWNPLSTFLTLTWLPYNQIKKIK